MDWLMEMEDERRLLKRVAAAFYLLACIAGLSCVMPLMARAYVLRVLRRIEALAIEIVSARARDRGLELHDHDHRIADALIGGDSRAEAMRFARSFRMLAILLNHLIEHYGCGKTSGIDINGSATTTLVSGYRRARSLLAKLCRSIADMTGRQLQHAPTRLAVAGIDSS